MRKDGRSAVAAWVYYSSLAFIVAMGACLLMFTVRLHQLEKEAAGKNAAMLLWERR